MWSVNTSSTPFSFHRLIFQPTYRFKVNPRVIPLFPEGVLEQTGLNVFQISPHLFLFDLWTGCLHFEVFSKNDYLTDLHSNLGGYIYSFIVDVSMALVLNCITRGPRTQSKVLDQSVYHSRFLFIFLRHSSIVFGKKSVVKIINVL